MNKLPILTEHQEAANLAEYLFILASQGKIELYSHIPHETYTKSWSAKRKNKIEGVMTGVPDYIIVTKQEVLFIELKRVVRSVTSFEQKQWILRLKGKTTDTAICRGFDEAKKFIDFKLSIL